MKYLVAISPYTYSPQVHGTTITHRKLRNWYEDSQLTPSSSKKSTKVLCTASAVFKVILGKSMKLLNITHDQ